MTETRYAQLDKVNPEKAKELLEVNKEEAQRRYTMYQRYLTMDFSDEYKNQFTKEGE